MSTLAQLLRERRDPVVARWMHRVRKTLRTERALDDEEVLDSIQFFIDALIASLEKGAGLQEAGKSTAQLHGAQRQALRRDITDVVREYGIFFECVVEECKQHGAGPVPVDEYALLARLLNSGAAEAVNEFAKLRELELRQKSWDHFAFLAHEIRNPLTTARLAATLLRAGPSARGLPALERSLTQLAELVDHSLVEARMRGLDSGASLHREQIDLRQLLEEALADAQPDAEARSIQFVLLAAAGPTVDADPRVLRSALSNIVRNAVKFTRSGGTVTVRAEARSVEVEDECGGLQAGDEKKIFGTFQQAGQDRSGFGLGLAIAQQAVQLHGWELEVRNLPGKGCVFAVKLGPT